MTRRLESLDITRQHDHVDVQGARCTTAAHQLAQELGPSVRTAALHADIDARGRRSLSRHAHYYECGGKLLYSLYRQKDSAFSQTGDQGAYTCEAINVVSRILVTPDCIVTVTSRGDCDPVGAVSPMPDANGRCICKVKNAYLTQL